MEALTVEMQAKIRKRSSERLRMYLIKAGRDEDEVMTWDRDKLMEEWALEIGKEEEEFKASPASPVETDYELQSAVWSSKSVNMKNRRRRKREKGRNRRRGKKRRKGEERKKRKNRRRGKKRRKGEERKKRKNRRRRGKEKGRNRRRKKNKNKLLEIL